MQLSLFLGLDELFFHFLLVGGLLFDFLHLVLDGRLVDVSVVAHSILNDLLELCVSLSLNLVSFLLLSLLSFFVEFFLGLLHFSSDVLFVLLLLLLSPVGDSVSKSGVQFVLLLLPIILEHLFNTIHALSVVRKQVGFLGVVQLVVLLDLLHNLVLLRVHILVIIQSVLQVTSLILLTLLFGVGVLIKILVNIGNLLSHGFLELVENLLVVAGAVFAKLLLSLFLGLLLGLLSLLLQLEFSLETLVCLLAVEVDALLQVLWVEQLHVVLQGVVHQDVDVELNVSDLVVNLVTLALLVSLPLVAGALEDLEVVLSHLHDVLVDVEVNVVEVILFFLLLSDFGVWFLVSHEVISVVIGCGLVHDV